MKLSASGDTLSVVVTVPDAPAGLAATAGDGQVSLSWNASSTATSYSVLRSTTSGGGYAQVAGGTTTATSFTDTTVASGTSYYYVVTATNLGGTSANSAEASATTIPAAPTGLTTSLSNAGGPFVERSVGASGYTILRATSPNGPYTTLATGVTGTSYTDTTALPGWTYYYAVSADNGSGQSQSSASATTTGASVAMSWLKLDETSGTSAADATGNNNTGTLVNNRPGSAGASETHSVSTARINTRACRTASRQPATTSRSPHGFTGTAVTTGSVCSTSAEAPPHICSSPRRTARRARLASRSQRMAAEASKRSIRPPP